MVTTMTGRIWRRESECIKRGRVRVLSNRMVLATPCSSTRYHTYNKGPLDIHILFVILSSRERGRRIDRHILKY